MELASLQLPAKYHQLLLIGQIETLIGRIGRSSIYWFLAEIIRIFIRILNLEI